MRFSCGQIVDAARALFRQYDATVSTWLDTNKGVALMLWLNDACRKVATLKEWRFLNREYEFNTVSTTINVISSGSSVSVKSIAGFYVGENIYITDGSTAERVKITAITAGGFTVTPSLTGTWAVGSVVGKIEYWLPRDIKTIKYIKRVGDYDPIVYYDEMTWDDNYAFQTLKGEPAYYCDHKNWVITEDLTATTSTNATTVIASALPAQITNNDYLNWILQARNASVDEWALVSANVYSTKTFNLDREITSMATGIAFRLIMNRPMYRIAPIPDAAYRMEVSYVAIPPDVINYYDYPEFGTEGEQFMDVLIYLLGVKMADDIGDAEMKANLITICNEGTKFMVDQLMGTGRRAQLLNMGLE